MLPKVATHILHNTSRAAAAVQSQTSHTIRNVLQSNSTSNLGSWNTSGSSSSWGHNSSYGAGPGPKYNHTGSRFYNGYTGAGRAVTQANVATSQDTSAPQSDDTDDLSARRSKLQQHSQPTTSRFRSHSLTIDKHDQTEESLGVLKTIQIHARSRHAFAQPLPSTDSTLLVADVLPTLSDVRQNSTAATPAESIPPPASPPPPTIDDIIHSVDPAAPQTTTPPTRPPTPPTQESSTYLALRAARDSRDPSLASTTVSNFLSNTEHHPSVAEFNMALEALHETRRPGEPLTQILETYNAMLARSLLPNIKTYTILILALTDRDHEVHRMIHNLTVRSNKRTMSGAVSPSSVGVDNARIDKLKGETNFGSAMSLFQAIIALGGNDKIPGILYNSLLRSCSRHASVESAIHVFAQLEARRNLRPSALIYFYMLSTYTNAGDFQGAKEVFEEFNTACKENRVTWTVVPSANKSTDHLAASRTVHIQIWNKMIEASFRCSPPVPVHALNLVETMLGSPAPPLFSATDVPPPASSTYTTIISGFIRMGDLDSALRWFEHLLGQDEPPRNPFEASKRPLRPDAVAWVTMLDALASAAESRVDDLNRIFLLYLQYAEKDGLQVRPVDWLIVFHANMQAVRKGHLDRQKTKELLDFVVEYVLSAELPRIQRRDFIQQVLAAYLDQQLFHSSIDLLRSFAASGLVDGEGLEESVRSTRIAVLNMVDQIHEAQKRTARPMSFETAIELARACDRVGVMPHLRGGYAAELLHSYAISKTDGQTLVEIGNRDWELLITATAELELPNEDGRVPDQPAIDGFAFEGSVSLLRDLASKNVDLNALNAPIVRKLIQAISVTRGVDELKIVLAELGLEYERMWANTERQLNTLADALAAPEVPAHDNVMYDSPEPRRPLRIDGYTTQFVDEVLQASRDGPRQDPLAAYGRFVEGIADGCAPSSAVLGRLIQALGRMGEVDKVREVYTVAQDVLHTLEYNKRWQSQAWFIIEDSMIIALAHAGDIDAAHVHRMRILEQGGAPTADAYGALILYVKDTTDDTSNAMALFQESQMQGIPVNLYLYNNIISKLAKARKADHALELFQEMKAAGIKPSSITYGALIGACTRVGDAQSAEILFDEMTRQPNFKPRIPPYNTMMQLYTSTKPNRERALFFYSALKQAGIKPTAHTYKLLIDAYGILEPIDIPAMENVFRQLENDYSVEMQGAHWASLINAWGCANKNLDKATEIFDSIPHHPRTSQSSMLLPDAVVFEAMVNVLVAHRRMDLMPHYMEKLNASRVHMTAYIANCLIKGYAVIGDLDSARSIFESLLDPPEGVAAPNNHAPHEPSQSPIVSPMEPVYREPSTWEVMVRAELGAGNRDRAFTLLERLHARQYPEAVYNRISGIMLDQSSASPWTT